MRAESRIQADIARFTAARQRIYSRLNGRAMPNEERVAIEALDHRIDALYAELRRVRTVSGIDRRRKATPALDRLINNELRAPARKGGGHTM